MRIVLAAVVAAAATYAVSSEAVAADCSRTSVGYVPLPQLGSMTYKGEIGGLYPGAQNEPPAAYAAAGRSAASGITPKDADGRTAPDGRVVLLAIGHSNTSQTFSAFAQVARPDPARDPRLVLVDGAQGGRDARRWASATDPVWLVVDERLRAAGVTGPQVQVIWIKLSLVQPRTDFATHARELAGALDATIRTAAERYPNLRQVFLSPRTYAGYATSDLNPEPYAYESAFAIRRLVAGSVASPTESPWIGWGAYLWADGTTSRDGFTWTCDDVAEDGTHQSPAGQQKVGKLMHQFFSTSPFTGWYRTGSIATVSPAARTNALTATATSLAAASPQDVAGRGSPAAAPFPVLAAAAIAAVLALFGVAALARWHR